MRKWKKDECGYVLTDPELGKLATVEYIGNGQWGYTTRDDDDCSGGFYSAREARREAEQCVDLELETPEERLARERREDRMDRFFEDYERRKRKALRSEQALKDPDTPITLEDVLNQE